MNSLPVFIGSPRMNFMDGVVHSSTAKGAKVAIPALGNVKIDVVTRDRKAEKGETVKVGMRPEHFIDGAKAKTKFKAKTSVVEQLGGVSYLYLDLGKDQQITVEQKGHSIYKGGDEAVIGIDPATTMLFDAKGLRI